MLFSSTYRNVISSPQAWGAAGKEACMTESREARIEQEDNSDILCDKIVNKKGEEEDKTTKVFKGRGEAIGLPFPPSMMRLLSLVSFSLSLSIQDATVPLVRSSSLALSSVHAAPVFFFYSPPTNTSPFPRSLGRDHGPLFPSLCFCPKALLVSVPSREQ